MTTTHELELLSDAVATLGGKVTLNYHANGNVESVEVIGCDGIGPNAMPAIFAAERLRGWCSEHNLLTALRQVLIDFRQFDKGNVMASLRSVAAAEKALNEATQILPTWKA